MMISKKLLFAALAIVGLVFMLAAFAAPGPVMGVAALPLVSVGFVVGIGLLLIFGIPAAFMHAKPYQDRFNELTKTDKK